MQRDVMSYTLKTIGHFSQTWINLVQTINLATYFTQSQSQKKQNLKVLEAETVKGEYFINFFQNMSSGTYQNHFYPARALKNPLKN